MAQLHHDGALVWEHYSCERKLSLLEHCCRGSTQSLEATATAKNTSQHISHKVPHYSSVVTYPIGRPEDVLGVPGSWKPHMQGTIPRLSG